MGVAEENTGDGGRGEAAHDRIKQRRGIGERIATVIAGQDMADDPGSLTRLFASRELVGEKGQDSRRVGIGHVPVIEDIVDVPEVCVDGDNAETRGCRMGIRAIVSGRVALFRTVDPAFIRPHGRKQLIVPRQRIRAGVGAGVEDVLGIPGLREAVVIPQCRVDRNIAQHGLKGLEGDGLFVLNVGPR